MKLCFDSAFLLLCFFAFWHSSLANSSISKASKKDSTRRQNSLKNAKSEYKEPDFTAIAAIESVVSFREQVSVGAVERALKSVIEEALVLKNDDLAARRKLLQDTLSVVPECEQRDEQLFIHDCITKIQGTLERVSLAVDKFQTVDGDEMMELLEESIQRRLGSLITVDTFVSEAPMFRDFPVDDSCGFLSIKDDSEGGDPDWSKIEAGFADGWLSIEISLHNLSTQLGHFIYMYGDLHRDVINFSNNPTFTMRRDAGADGHFEQVVYTGTMAETQKGSSQVLSFQIPLEKVEDVASKEIWVYSMTSRDRIPNTGRAKFKLCSQSSPVPPTVPPTSSPIVVPTAPPTADPTATPTTDSSPTVDLTIAPTPSPTISPTDVPESTASKCVHGLDESDGENPDLKSLTVRYDDDFISVEICLHQKSDAPPGYLYMYGVHRDVIGLSRTGFDVRRDHGADGHFEERVCKGSIVFYGFAARFHVPIDCIPDIASKRIWIFSSKNRDRIPEKGELSFTTAKDDECPTEEVADIPSDIATVDPSEQADTVTISDNETGDGLEVEYDVVPIAGGISSLTAIKDLIEDVSCDNDGNEARVTIIFDDDVSLPNEDMFNSEILVVDGSLFGSCVLGSKTKQSVANEAVDGYMFIDSETREKSNTIELIGQPASLFDLFEESKISIVNGGRRRHLNEEGQTCENLKKKAESKNGLLTVELDGSICALTRLDKLDIDLSGGLNIDAVFSFGLSAAIKGKYILSRDLKNIIEENIPLFRKVLYGVRFKWFDGLLPDIRVGFFLEPGIVVKLKPSAAFTFDSSIDVKLPTQTAIMAIRDVDVGVSVVGEEFSIEGTVTSETSLKAELGVEGFVGISPSVTGYLLNDYVSVKADIPAGLFLNAVTQVPQFPACKEDCDDERPSCTVPHDGEVKASVGVEGAVLSYTIDISEQLGLDPKADKFNIFESFSYEILKLCLCCDLTNIIPCREDYCIKTPDPTPQPTSRPTLQPTPQPPPAIPCSATVRPGGGRLMETFSVEMGTSRGSFFMSYNMVNIPDRIQVFYEGQPIYDSIVKLSGCYSDILISYGPGAATRVDFVITSDDTDTEWTVATGCPSSIRPPDIGCSQAPVCNDYPSVNSDYTGCSCQAVNALSGPCGSNSQFPIPVAGVCTQNSQVVNYACCCRRRPPVIANPQPPPPSPRPTFRPPTPRPIARPPPVVRPPPRPPSNLCGSKGSCTCYRLYCPASRPVITSADCPLSGGFCCCTN